jgi:hypothetical protein
MIAKASFGPDTTILYAFILVRQQPLRSSLRYHAQHTGPSSSDAADKEKEKANDPNEDTLDSHSQPHILARLKHIGQFLKPSKQFKEGRASPHPPPEEPSAPESPGGASPHASLMASDVRRPAYDVVH